MNTFDYVEYDETSKAAQAKIKEAFVALEKVITDNVRVSFAERTLAIRSLQVSYAWCGHAIKNDQIQLSGSAKLQEGRNQS